MKTCPILIFETHPVQYRAPLYRALAEDCGVDFCVIYGSDFSLRGYQDREFGTAVQWDQPLLEGYPCEILPNLRGEQLMGICSLSGRGVGDVFSKYQPATVLLTSLRFAYDFAALAWARFYGCRVLLRQETQDQAFQRSATKSLLRDCWYRLLYSAVDTPLAIGQLNRAHYRRLGFAAARPNVPYTVVNPFAQASTAELQTRRERLRKALGLLPALPVLGFSGKLIPKKNPDLLLDLVSGLQQDGQPCHALFIGDGELRAPLQARAAQEGLPVTFTGFVNQSQLPDYYLAIDTLVLPSRRMGETWGLVVNEGLHAGCSILTSDAVGCSAEFGSWPRVGVFQEGNPDAALQALRPLLKLPRDFEWAQANMAPYSINHAARMLSRHLQKA